MSVERLPCSKCGIVHSPPLEVQMAGRAPLATVVLVKSGMFSGRVGCLIEWSTYGTDLSYRVEFGRDVHGYPARANYRPCEVEPWRP